LLFLSQRLIFFFGPERHHSGLTIPSSFYQDDFQKELDESAGFFDDMHLGDWQKLKKRIRATLIAALTVRPPDLKNGTKPIGSQHLLVSTSGASADGATVASGYVILTK